MTNINTCCNKCGPYLEGLHAHHLHNESCKILPRLLICTCPDPEEPTQPCNIHFPKEKPQESEKGFYCEDCGEKRTEIKHMKGYCAKHLAEHTKPQPEHWEERVVLVLRCIGVEDHIPAIIAIFRKELASQRARILDGVGKMKKPHEKNPTHQNDELWCCIECYEDKVRNSALEDVEKLIKEL